MPRVLVTGGLGFIGAEVVRQLLAEGCDVRVVDAGLPLAHATPPPAPPGVETMRGDLRDPDVAAAAVAGVDAVCHQAAMVGMGLDFADVADYVSHNDLGTAVLLRALAAARFGGRLVLASSMVVYGEGAYRCAVDGPVRPAPRRVADLEAGRFEPTCPRCDRALAPETIPEDAPLEPRSVYAATKLQQEHLVEIFAREHDVPAVRLRYHNVYGPGMPRDTPYAGVASIFRSAVERGEAPQVFEDGGQLRDFVHVADVARANLRALATDAPAGAFNIASGEPHSIADLARVVAGALGGAAAPRVTGAYRAGDVRHVLASPARAAAELGFRARIGFAEGMAAFATAPLRARA